MAGRIRMRPPKSRFKMSFLRRELTAMRTGMKPKSELMPPPKLNGRSKKLSPEKQKNWKVRDQSKLRVPKHRMSIQQWQWPAHRWFLKSAAANLISSKATPEKFQ